MKINWKVRIMNPQFWIMIFLAVASPVSVYFNVTGTNFTTWGNVFDLVLAIIQNPFVLFSIGVSVYNAVIDPTTKGMKDSPKALTYKKPK